MLKRSFQCINIVLFCLALPMIAWAATIAPIANPQVMWVGARQISLGGAPVTLTGDLNNLFINSACIGTIESFQFSINHQNYLDELDYTSIHAVIPYKPFDIALGISFGTNQVNDVPYTTYEDDRIRQLETSLYGMSLLQFSGSRVFFEIFGFDEISIGSGLKIYQQVVKSDTKQSYGVDSGLILSKNFSKDFFNRVRLGISVLNMISTPIQRDNISQFPIQLLFSGQADLLQDRLSVFAQQSFNGLNAGLEYHLQDNLFIRGSSNLKQLNLGTGLNFERVSGFSYDDFNLSIDYNYSQNIDTTTPLYGNKIHTVSISILGVTQLKRPKILVPATNYITKEKTAHLSGVGDPHSSILIYSNKSLRKTIRTDQFGKWEVPDFELKTGPNQIYLKSYSLEKETSFQTDKIEIVSDRIAPNLNVDVNYEGLFLRFVVWSSESLQVVEGIFNDRNLTFSRISEKNWVGKVPMPTALDNKAIVQPNFFVVKIVGRDLAGNENEPVTIPLFLSIQQPLDQVTHYSDTINTIGQGSPVIERLQINGVPVNFDRNYGFIAPVSLDSGQNLIQFKLTNKDTSVLNYFARVLRLVTFPDIQNITEKREIEYLASMGILDFSDLGKFRPDEPVRRIDLVKVLMRIFKDEPTSVNDNLFSDVEKTSPDAPYVQTAINKGYLFAYPDGTFKPNEPLPINDLFTTLSRLDIINPDKVYNDEQILTRKQLAIILAYSDLLRPVIQEFLEWKKPVLKY